MFGKNALVVDDSLTARSILKHQLNQFEVVVESAPDGNHALKMLRSHTPDVIFLDHVMPGLDGFQVLERLKADSATRRIPVVMYTSQAAPQYIREAKILGAVAVIPKNVTDEALVDALNKAEVYQLGAANDDRHGLDPVGRDKSDTVSAPPVRSPVMETRPAYPAGEAGGSPRPAPGHDKAATRPVSGRSGPLALLLTILVASQGYMLWRDRQQQQVISELRRASAVEELRVSALDDRVELQQEQLHATNAYMVELIMKLLMERVEAAQSQAAEEPVEDAADTTP